MIESALAARGSFADLWSYVKSIDHALARCSTKGTMPAPLDKERLSALAGLLREVQLSEKPADPQSYLDIAAASIDARDARRYAPDADFREIIRKNPEFEQWLTVSKIGFEKKIARLVAAIETYLKGQSKEVVAPREPPQEEFSILKSITKGLLAVTPPIGQG